MSTEHLGERLSALVDGELGAAERDRALIHLASCDACRFEADMLRRLKRRLHGLDGPEPASDLLGRLSALGSPAAEPPQGPPEAGGGPRPFGGSAPLGSGPALGDGPGLGQRPGFGAAGTGGPAPRWRSQASALRAAAAFLPFRSPSGDRRELEAAERRPRPARQRRRAPRYAMAGASLVAVALGGAFVAGGEDEPGPVVRPPLPDYALEHALTAGEAALPNGDDGRRAGGEGRGTVPALHEPGRGGAEGTGGTGATDGTDGTGREDRGGRDRDDRDGAADGGADTRTDTPRAW
ncbi:anti-sigma factor family protein [Nocardiopsis chromatogenes]|uniref:anti-sigma factor family protein n=1 Tax=Nocardiopsis chromatogenes TaxID=280239 RepID=UPI00034815F4|nr:anti-sigma factor [Nocardiopsis chromatogenes]